MPWIKKRCHYPGCQEWITTGSYCSIHKKAVTRVYEMTRDPMKKAFYNSGYWKSLRTAQLDREPLCRVCLREGRVVIGVHVDHVDGNQDNNDFANLQTLCASCHSRKHASEENRFKSE